MRARIVTGPRLTGALVLLVIAAALFFALRKPAVAVETATVTRGPMTVTIDDLGETRVADLYVVSAPITGELQRVPLKPGDRIALRKTVLAWISPVEASPLDARSYAQAQANVRSLTAALAAAHARIGQVRAEQRLAQRELERASELARRGFVTRSNLDRSRTARDRSSAALAEAEQSAVATAANLAAARAALLPPGSRTRAHDPVAVTSAVGGYVLRVPQESERVVVAGTPLVEIGDPDKLEIVTDLLSNDAVQVQPGAPVQIEGWGGERPIRGRVRLVEPFGFTKVSALGVEEQRVNVVIDFDEPRAQWARLGHGYRATLRISTWFGPDVVRVPIGALFRSAGKWNLFVLDADRRARRVAVQIGHLNDDFAEVVSGLTPGTRVILHPTEKVTDGVRVRPLDEAQS